MRHISTFTLVVISMMSTLSGCITEKAKSIDYLSQKPPGKTAELFAPGLITTQANEHSALVFSPDGTTVLWAVMDKNYRGSLQEMKFEKGSWTKPASPSFADTTADHYAPSFSPDGKTLYFSSRRQAPPGYREGQGNRIWKVERHNLSWGTPSPIDTIVSKAEEFSHSISDRGTFYFASAMGSKNMDLHFAERSPNVYSTPSRLSSGINTEGYEDGPFIAADESYLIFESTRPNGIEGSHDLYITFKTKDGSWGDPINMGPKINSGAMERFPRVSPDGRYLFFASNRDQSNGKTGFDFYWIDASLIDELRQSTLH